MRSKLTLFLTAAIASVCFVGLSAPVMAENPPSGDQESLQQGEDKGKKKGDAGSKEGDTQDQDGQGTSKPAKKKRSTTRSSGQATTQPAGLTIGVIRNGAITIVTREDEDEPGTCIVEIYVTEWWWVDGEIVGFSRLGNRFTVPCEEPADEDEGTEEDDGAGDSNEGGTTTQPADKKIKKTDKKKKKTAANQTSS